MLLGCGRELHKINGVGKIGIDTLVGPFVEYNTYMLSIDSINEIKLNNNLIELRIKKKIINDASSKYYVSIKEKRNKDKLFEEAQLWFQNTDTRKMGFQINNLNVDKKKLEISGNFKVNIGKKKNDIIEYNVYVNFDNNGEYHYYLINVYLNGAKLENVISLKENISNSTRRQIAKKMNYLMKNFNESIPDVEGNAE